MTGWFILIAGSQAALSQIGHPLICTDQTQIRLTLIDQQDKLNVDRGKTISKLDYLDTVIVRLVQTDLVLEFKTVRQQKDFEYHIEFQVNTTGGRTIKPQPRHLVGVNELSTGASSQIIWKDFTELGLHLMQPFTLIIQTALYGELNINCGGDAPARPLDNLLAKRVYLAAGVIGSGLGIFSLIQRSAAQKSYDNYQRDWRQNLPEGKVENHLEKAKNKNSSFESVGIIGAGILAATGLIYLDNVRKYQRARKRYEKYCCGAIALELEPMLEAGNALSDLSLGVSLKLHF